MGGGGKTHTFLSLFFFFSQILEVHCITNAPGKYFKMLSRQYFSSEGCIYHLHYNFSDQSKSSQLHHSLASSKKKKNTHTQQTSLLFIFIYKVKWFQQCSSDMTFILWLSWITSDGLQNTLQGSYTLGAAGSQSWRATQSCCEVSFPPSFPKL